MPARVSRVKVPVRRGGAEIQDFSFKFHVVAGSTNALGLAACPDGHFKLWFLKLESGNIPIPTLAKCALRPGPTRDALKLGSENFNLRPSPPLDPEAVGVVFSGPCAGGEVAEWLKALVC